MKVLHLRHMLLNQLTQRKAIIAVRSSLTFVGFWIWTIVLTWWHRFSKGLRLSDCAGQSTTVMPSSLDHSRTSREVWQVALSCWSAATGVVSMGAVTMKTFSKISMYSVINLQYVSKAASTRFDATPILISPLPCLIVDRTQYSHFSHNIPQVFQQPSFLLKIFQEETVICH